MATAVILMIAGYFKNQTDGTALPESAEGMADILDIEGIIRFPWEKVFEALLIVCIVVLTVFIVAMIIRFIKKRLSTANREDLLPPHKKALLEIQKLDQQKLIEKGEYRKYYFFLSEIFRRYITDQLHYPAIDKTVDEIIPDLGRSLVIPDEMIKETEKFFRKADLIKFASFTSSPSAAGQDKEHIIHIINVTAEPVDQGQDARKSQQDQAGGGRPA